MKVVSSGLVLGFVLIAGTAWAAGTMSPQQIVDDRVAGMKSLVGNVKGAHDATDPAVAKDHLAKAIAFAESIPSKFPKGTGVGDAGVTKSRALQDIWSKPADFKAAADALAKALKGASDAVGDATKFEAAFGDVKKSCGGCHTPFRGPETPQ
ncbi:MAG: cytochrome c [Micropepsaceae bacterium]